MNLAQLEDLLLRLKRLAVKAQRQADLEDSRRAVDMGGPVTEEIRDRLYELPVALREASEVVEEAVVARRRREVCR